MVILPRFIGIYNLKKQFYSFRYAKIFLIVYPHDTFLNWTTLFFTDYQCQNFHNTTHFTITYNYLNNAKNNKDNRDISFINDLPGSAGSGSNSRA